ncbi:hypothetical protein BA920_07870 [Helicobacter pullorum]|uniref:hypothetical protein n=1 Tax=Helicobacter pullorum TaxID=35818 RepID=UPI000816ACA0|nr:hypothetical protein [Helicobacter pullorum]OCR03733.1 hypothetical protein BA920_07870 [Helicobacter pullorum]OCR18428.1 hypothetical protein BA918_07345 [Helicobacter pullorum]
MPLPFILGGIAIAAAAAGAKKGYDAYQKNTEANELQERAENILDKAKGEIESARKSAQNALEDLGKAKLRVWEHSVRRFIKLFEQLKNVDMQAVNMETSLTFDKAFFDELKRCEMEVASMFAGGIGGIGAGALTAFGAYGATMAFASASTGTAIASLSGVAATNATLAWLGGGSLAAGGLGVAGGAAVLGGLVAGPAIAILGFTLDAASNKKLDEARANLAQARKMAEELKAATEMTHFLRHKIETFENLLIRLDMTYNTLLDSLEDTLQASGEDYKTYSKDAKMVVAANIKITETIKAVLDTSIINKKGTITKECENLLANKQTMLEDAAQLLHS